VYLDPGVYRGPGVYHGPCVKITPWNCYFTYTDARRFKYHDVVLLATGSSEDFCLSYVVFAETLNTFNRSSAVAEMGDRARVVGRKAGVCCAPFRGESWVASNTMSPGPRLTSIPSGILIHPLI